jgi:hypothetical protein
MSADIVISMVEDAYSTATRRVSVQAIINAVKRGRWQQSVERIRYVYQETLKKTGSHEEARKSVEQKKKALPGVTWSGTFSRRGKEYLLKHSGLFCGDIDVDALAGKDLREVRAKLQTSPHVVAFFLSPTGVGLKVIVRVRADASRHDGSYRAVERHILELVGVQIDESGKDEARLCFVSYDPNAYINLNAREITPLPKLQVLRDTHKPSVAPLHLGERRRIAVLLLGEIRWDSETHGFLTCPGEHLHTTGDGDRDCEIHLDGAPTVHCFHNHCTGIRAGVNHELQSRIGMAERAAEVDLAASINENKESHDELTSLTSLGAVDYPAPLEQAAFHGLAGDFVKRVEPHTEADPVALLIQFLIAYGNVSGRTAHATADGAPHYCNEDVVVVGETSKSRKGTGLKHVKNLFKYADPTWSKNCVTTGLSSGEGLISAVRDPIEKMEDGEIVPVDPGVSDKRLMVIEEEFSKVLVVADRKDNTLSAILRSAWDGDEVLRSMTKNSPARATGALISILGHITREELRKKLTETASANGFGNRFLWPAVRRSKVLPEGGGSYGIADLVERLKKALAFVKQVGELKRDEAARKLWAQIYPALSAGKPGLLGAITARAEAHVLRLSDLYALLDCSALVRVEHLRAALAVWKYCEDSARWIFETRTGDRNADRILAALKVAGGKGITKWEINSDVFNRHATRFEIDEALRVLYHAGLAYRKEEKTKTRPAERWFYQAKPREGSEESTPAVDTSHSSPSLASENASLPTGGVADGTTDQSTGKPPSEPPTVTRPTSIPCGSDPEDPEGEALI